MCRRWMTPFQLADSAKAPWTRTTVGFSVDMTGLPRGQERCRSRFGASTGGPPGKSHAEVHVLVLHPGDATDDVDGPIGRAPFPRRSREQTTTTRDLPHGVSPAGGRAGRR